MTREQAIRLWKTLPLAGQALVEVGVDLIDTFVPGAGLHDRAVTCVPVGRDWLVRLAGFVERKERGSLAPSLQQSDLFEQYTRVVQALSRKVPLVLVVDDLQWADRGSIGLLFHLGRHLAGSRILLVGAYRPEEVAIGRDGERHPLQPVVNEFQRNFGELTVSLGRAESREFVDALLDSEPNRLELAFRDMLYRQTHGHPLFTVELLRGMQERGDLVRDAEDRWVAGPALDWETLPARVEAAIAERIGRLAQPLRAALRVASVEGEVFTAEVLARVVGAGEREMVQRLSSELDRRHRLVRAQAIERLGAQRVSRYRFRHNLFQQYLYDNLDQVERSYLHEDVGTVLETLFADRASGTAEAASTTAVAVQLARHFEESGITEKAIRYLHQAGDRAVQLSAYREATAHLTRGLELLVALPDPGDAQSRLARAEQELALQISLGLAWKWNIPSPEGEKILTRARELCQQTGETSQLCQVLGELSIFPYVRAEYRTARELVEEALSLAQQAGDPLLVALHHWHLGYVLFGLGEFLSARDHFQQVLSFYVPHEHHHALVALRGSDAGLSALAYDACSLWCLGYPEQAMVRSQEALDLARELDHPFSAADVLCFGGCMLDTMRRDTLALREHAQEMVRVSEGVGIASFSPTASCFFGEALTKLGQVQEGIAQLRESLATRQSLGVRCYASGMLGALAWAEGEAGQPEEGLATLDEALAMVEETDERYCESDLYRQRADLLLRLGKEGEAEASLQHAVEVARRQEARSWELRATTGLARLWQRQGKVADARQVLARIYGWFSEGFDTPDLKEAREFLKEIT
jgi:adenylate cyclase